MHVTKTYYIRKVEGGGGVPVGQKKKVDPRSVISIPHPPWEGTWYFSMIYQLSTVSLLIMHTTLNSPKAMHYEIYAVLKMSHLCDYM